MGVKKYPYALKTYSMTVSSYYQIIMERAINYPGNGKNVVYSINATEKNT